MLRLAEKWAKGLLVISPAGIDCVTRNFSYRLLVSYSQAAQFDPENTLANFMIDTYKSQNVNRIQCDIYDDHMIILPLYKGGVWCGNNYMYGTFPRYFYIPTFLLVKYTRPPTKICHILPCPLYNIYYLAQMRGCVARNDLWPWAISSRSFSHWAVTSPISWITFICGTNITHRRRPFPGQ